MSRFVLIQSWNVNRNCQTIVKTSKLQDVLMACTAFVFAVIFIPAAQADLVTLTGDIAAGTGQITINNDITFDINTSGNVLTMVFDEWTTSDGTPALAHIAGDTSVFGYSINGGGTLTTNTRFRDNFGMTLGDISPNDGYLTFESLPPVSPGDVFTVKAGTYSIDATAGFNPALNNYSFCGSVFLTNTAGNRISNIVVGVPEPSSVLLLGISWLGWLIRRVKK